MVYKFYFYFNFYCVIICRCVIEHLTDTLNFQKYMPNVIRGGKYFKWLHMLHYVKYSTFCEGPNQTVFTTMLSADKCHKR